MDRFENQGSGLNGPFTAGTPVTPADDTDLIQVARALWIGGSGSVSVVPLDGPSVVFPAIGPGWLPMRVRRVNATGTTATGIVAAW